MESNSVNIRCKCVSSKCKEVKFENVRLDCLKAKVAVYYELPEDDFYLTQNGRILTQESSVVPHNTVEVMLRLVGGKGGFGSMLRAIGAQIEKTTNRDACRDLSGRRLRDINEEQRLKRWFAKQAEREQEKEEQRKKKLEKLRQFNEGPPLPILDDPEYNRQRAEMADSVYDAVDKGYESSKKSTSTAAASSSSSSSSAVQDDDEVSKEAATEIPTTSAASTSTTSKPVETKQPKKKIKKLMMDDDFSTDSSDSESDSEPVAKKAKQ